MTMGKQRLAFMLVFLLLLMPLSNSFSSSNDPASPLIDENNFFSAGNTTDWAVLMTKNSATQGGPNNENWVKITDVIVDSNDDIYAVGAFYNNVTIGSSNWDEGRSTGFIAKFDAQGNSLWELKIEAPQGSTDPTSEIRTIDVDNAGRVYVGGWMCGASTFTMTSGCGWWQNWGGFVAKVSPMGTFEWGISVDGANGYDVVNDVAIRSDGHVWAVGFFRDSAFFEGVSYNTSGRYDGFAALINTTSSDFEWVRTIGSQSHTETDNATAVTVDSDDNALIVGAYADNAGSTFGATQIMPVGKPTATYVLNLSSTNTVNWVASAVGSQNGEPSFGMDILVADDGNYYVTGGISGLTTFDSLSTGSLLQVVGNGTSVHTYVAKIETDGDWNYARRSDSPNGFNDPSHQTPQNMRMGQNGIIIITGQYDSPYTHPVSSATFGNIELLDGYMGGYLAGFNIQTASWAWATDFGSGGDNDVGTGVGVLSDGRIVTSMHVCSKGPCYADVDGVQYNIPSYEGGSGILWMSYPDSDSDNIPDKDDNCDLEANPSQSDIDQDNDGDACDNDLDGDGKENFYDNCDGPSTNWDSSIWINDRDQDGCRDLDEDKDDDGDGIEDVFDDCNSVSTIHNWSSTSVSDYDTDGCKDSEEDEDDDSDGINDSSDSCPVNPSWKNWTSNQSTDHDGDGCKDEGEDSDDDNDQRPDDSDDCPTGEKGWTSEISFDYDQDGCRDSTEDLDDDGDGIPDFVDSCNPPGATDWTSLDPTDNDGDGCRDSDEDFDDDNDGIEDANDACPDGVSGWTSNPSTDNDGDGCKDLGADNDGYGEDTDDDGDQILDSAPDMCPQGATDWISTFATDFDRDGCKDDGEDSDDDGDGFYEDNGEDLCPNTPVGEFVDINGCSEGQADSDGDLIIDADDQCPQEDSRNFDANLDGCIDDTDGDGINDAEDVCPSVSADETGILSQIGDGCTITERDDDGDGIAGDMDVISGNDICPLTLPGASTNEFGCSQDQIWDLLDSDQDGVSDLVEFEWGEESGLNCTNTPESERSIVDVNGCGFSQLDADSDSIPNGIDICPGTPALLSVDEAGCSVSQKEQTSSSSGPPAFVIASVIVVFVISLGAGVMIIAQRNNKSNKKSKRRSKKKIPNETTAPIAGEYSDQAALALAPEPIPLPELSGNTVDEDGIEWAQDANGNWYWKEENGQFKLYQP